MLSLGRVLARKASAITTMNIAVVAGIRRLKSALLWTSMAIIPMMELNAIP